MTRGKETACTTELIKSIFAAGGFAWKIPDPTPGGYKTAKRPFDVFGCFNGKMFAIEAKYMPRYGPFGPNKLAEHQHKALGQVLDAGGLSYVVLFVSSHRKNRLFVFKYADFRRLSKSYTHVQMLDMPYIEKKGSVYNVDWLKNG